MVGLVRWASGLIGIRAFVAEARVTVRVAGMIVVSLISHTFTFEVFSVSTDAELLQGDLNELILLFLGPVYRIQ